MVGSEVGASDRAATVSVRIDGVNMHWLIWTFVGYCALGAIVCLIRKEHDVLLAVPIALGMLFSTLLWPFIRTHEQQIRREQRRKGGG